MRKSKYDDYSKDELQEIIDQSTSIRDVIRKVGLSANGQGGYRTFHKKMKQFGIDIEPLKGATPQKTNGKRGRSSRDLALVLVKDSDYSRSCLKSRLLKLGFLKK